MPKAIALSNYGGPEVLHSIEFDEPIAGPGEVAVQVKAAGVQPVDGRIRSGAMARWIPVKFPQVLGNEFAGVIRSAGPDVTGFKPGDQVIGFTNMGSYSERVVVPATNIAIKPDNMPWEIAGTLSASGQTAYSVLQQLGVKEKDTVLIHAAAGGVGTVAVQVAKIWGARVIGTASEHNHPYLRSLGAEPVTYGDGLVERVRKLAPEGVDAALDCAGGQAILASLELVEDRKRIGTIADPMTGSQHGVAFLSTQRSAEKLKDLIRYWEQGVLKLSIWKSYPLAETAEAHREVATGHVRGKIVLTMDG